MRGFLNALFFFQIVFVAAMNPKYAEPIRDLLIKQNPPPWITIQDSLQPGQLSFTSADLKNIYIDLEKFKDSPHTLQSVIKHEIAHTQGAVHNDGSPYMEYHVTEDAAGNIVDDAWVLLP